MTVIILKYIKINSVISLHLIIDKINRYNEESNETKYLMIVPTNGSKYILEKYEELWTKIRDLKVITQAIMIKKYMKIKFNSDDDLPLKKTLELRYMVVVVASVFHENSRYYPHVLLDECL